MGGFFGATSRRNCILDVFFGTDYHSHLGTRRGGMAAWDKDVGMQRNVVNLPLHTQLLVPCGHAAPAGTQVGVVVRAEENIQNAVAAGCGAKKTTHEKTSLFCAWDLFCQLGLKRCVFLQNLGRVAGPLGIQLGGKGFVGDGDDLGS